MAKNHSKPLVSNISGKYWEELCMTGNEMATSDCLGVWISCLQLLHAFAIPIMHLMWNRLQKKIGLITSLQRLLTTIWQRKAVWKTLFQNKPSGTINPVYLPRKLLNNTKNVSINETLSLTTHAQEFILQLGRNILRTTMTSIVFCFGNHAMERNASTFVLWTW